MSVHILMDMTQDILHFIDRALVISHVVAGMLALVMGPLAMLTSKGGVNHRRWGKIYFWGMAWIFISVFALAFFRFSFFLLVIAVFSFYQALTGYRALYRKQPDQGRGPTGFDWLSAALSALFGAGFVAWGVLGLLNLQPTSLLPYGTSLPFSILGILFGLQSLNLAFVDMRSFSRKPDDKNWWWFFHMSRFGGAYIATVTAFVVQNISRYLPAQFAWVTWVAPALVGSPLLAAWIIYYRRKFAAQRMAQQSGLVVNVGK